MTDIYLIARAIIVSHTIVHSIVSNDFSFSA